jgi:hypothetical protein
VGTGVAVGVLTAGRVVELEWVEDVIDELLVREELVDVEKLEGADDVRLVLCDLLLCEVEDFEVVEDDRIALCEVECDVDVLCEV